MVSGTDTKTESKTHPNQKAVAIAVIDARYLRIKGSFLAVKVERINGEPTITFRHYGPDGKIYNE